MFLLFLFCTTKIGEISDIAKCFENFVSQTLGFLTSFYAAELRDYTEHYEEKLGVFGKFFHFLCLTLDFCCIFAHTKVEPDVFFRRHSGRNCGIQAEIAAFRQKLRRSGGRFRSFPLRFHIHIILK